jgi:hypothetical protein
VGIIDRVERGLERAVKAPFARVFKAEVQPVEIASAMRGAMDERAAVLGPGRTMVPNVFTVELAKSDYERLSSYDTALTDELVAAAEDHADAQRYTPAGPVEVRLTSAPELETGIFRVRPASRNTRRPGRRQGPPSQQRQPDRPRPELDQRQGPDQRHGIAGRPQPEDMPQGRPPRQAQLQSGQAPAGLGAAGAVAARGPREPSQDEPRTRTFPAPPSPRQRTQSARGPAPWIDVDGRRHSLAAAVTTLGRDDSADVVIDDPGVSRRHVELRISHDGPHLQVVVRDLGSTNGTYLNGDQVGTEQLGDGDRLTMGRTTVTFHLDGGR